MIAHRSPNDMARCLVTYINDPDAVRREVLAEFSTSPSIHTIRHFMIAHRNRTCGSGSGKYDSSIVGANDRHETAMEKGCTELMYRINSARLGRVA
jgi:hypothetical protein